MVWTDIPAEAEADFNDWYDREHLRERAEVPGFIRARRFAAISGEPKYIALYETQNAEVMRSESYLRFKRTRDARTMHFTRLFRNTIKATCDVTARAGVGEGAFLVVLPITVDAARRAAFRDWAGNDFLEACRPRASWRRRLPSTTARYARRRRRTMCARATVIWKAC